MSWIKTQFKDVVQFPPKVPLEKGELYSFIPMEDLSSGIKYVSPKTEKTWNGSGGAKFEEGDTLFARITPCLQNGKISQAKNLKNGKGFGSTEYFIFRGIEGVSDSDFIYYFSLNEEFKKYAIGSMVGASGRQRADQKFVGEFEINLPPLPTQKRIASILSAYDDSIENNLKRIKLLEETAQNIYKEWFVHFRFPNYEHTAFDEASGLPVGWERTVIGNYCKVGRGSSPRPIKDERFFNEGKIPWVKIADATSSTIFISKTNQYVNELGASFSRLLKRGSIILAASGTLGFPMILGVDACIHDGWIYIYDYDEKMKYFQYYQFKSLTEYFYSISYGAAIQNINTGIVSNSPVILPTTELLHKFNNTVDKIFINIECLQNQNQNLKEARDILLPRLMNRTIEV
jgi:type I restriction enzyme S subunit